MIEWTAQAAEQLEQAHSYITLSNNEQVATRVTARIVTSVQQLDMFPMSGRAGRVRGTREVVVAGTPFVVAYSVLRDRIVVLAIYHGAQKWPETF